MGRPQDVGCVRQGFVPYLVRIYCPKVRCVHPSKWPFWLRASVHKKTLAYIRFRNDPCVHPFSESLKTNVWIIWTDARNGLLSNNKTSCSCHTYSNHMTNNSHITAITCQIKSVYSVLATFCWIIINSHKNLTSPRSSLEVRLHMFAVQQTLV